MVLEVFSPTVKGTRKRKLEELLRHIQRGSFTHVCRLLDDWPQDRNVDIVEALIPLLSVDKLSPEKQLSRQDIDLTSTCIPVLSRILPFDEILPGDPRDPAIDLIIDNVDSLFSWMTLCLLQVGGVFRCENLQCHTHGLIQNSASLFMMYIHVCRKLRAAMQASPIVARFVALLWMWTDPEAKLPLSIVRQDGEENGCLCIQMLYEYTSTEEGKMHILEQLAVEGFGEAAAERFVLVGMGRAEGLKKKCKALQDSDTKLSTIAYNYSQLIDIFNDFIGLGDPILLSALSKFPFIRQFTAGLSSIGSRVWVREPHLTTAEFNGLPLSMLVVKLLRWTMIPGLPACDGVCQFLRGGAISLYLNMLIHAPRPCDHNQELRDTCEQFCYRILNIRLIYSTYPSVVKTLAEVLSNVDKAQLKRLESRSAEDPMCHLWTKLKNSPGLRFLSDFERVGRPAVCDNLLHREVPGMGEEAISDNLRTCSRCHAVMYCSEKCQSIDWNACHRFDCPQLSLEYQGRKIGRTWFKASTRLFHFFILEGFYRHNAVHIVAARHRRHPCVPLEELIVSFDYIAHLSSPGDNPNVYTVAEYLDASGPRSKALGGIGRRRLEMMIGEFRTQADIRIVEGIFGFGEMCLWVVARVRTFVDEDGMEDSTRACVLGGASYLGLKCVHRSSRQRG